MKVDQVKSTIFLTIFVLTSAILAWGVWNNYKPQVIYASCTDIAETTTNLRKSKDIVEVGEGEFDSVFNNCLGDSGYFAK